MEQGKGYTTAAVSGGSIAGAWDSIKQLAEVSPLEWHINWQQVLQVGVNAAVGAVVGLLVKLAWDVVFEDKKIHIKFWKTKK